MAVDIMSWNDWDSANSELDESVAAVFPSPASRFSFEDRRLALGAAYKVIACARKSDGPSRWTLYARKGRILVTDALEDIFKHWGRSLYYYHTDDCYWLHVHDLPCRLCSESLFKLAPEDTVPAAARLPVEIIRMIGLAMAGLIFTQSYISSLELFSHSLTTRQGSICYWRFTQHALVCKRWTDMFLRQEWNANLHGASDIMVLRSLASAPCSYLKHSITACRLYTEDAMGTGDNTITLPLSEMRDPWLHLLPDTYRLLANYRQDGNALLLIGPLGGGVRTMRSIHAYLPRSLAAFSCNISQLLLQDISFQRFSNLEHVLYELSNLRQFKGHALSWNDSYVFARPSLHIRKVQNARQWWSPEITLRGCTSDLEAARLTISQHERHLEQWVILRSVLQSVAQCTGDIQIVASSKHENFVTHNTSRRIFYTINSQQHGFKTENRVLLSVVQRCHVDPPNFQEMKLAISFSSAGFRSITWDPLDETISAQLQITSVVISTHSDDLQKSSTKGVSTTSTRQLIIEALPRSYAAGKLFFSSGSVGAFYSAWDKAWTKKADAKER